MRLFIIVLLIVCGLAIDSFFDAARSYPISEVLTFRLSDLEIPKGYTLLLECFLKESQTPEKLSITLITDLTLAKGDIPLQLYPHPTQSENILFALIGIPYNSTATDDSILVEWTESDRVFAQELPFKIIAGPYRSEQIKGVPQNRVTPSASDYQRISRERKMIARAYEPIQATTTMANTFSDPVDKRTITSPYGTRRLFNGQLRSYHGGLDLRAYEGTSIKAAQAGIVKLAQNLFYAGNHVLLEHGMGIHTGYSHMSKLYVKKGDIVNQGQILGLSGSTGRVTAAHLHWTVNVNGVGVSPLQFTEILEKLYRKPVEPIR